MNNKEYDKLVKSVVGKESVLKNVMIAFFSGGVVGIIAEVMNEFYFKIFNRIFKSWIFLIGVINIFIN